MEWLTLVLSFVQPLLLKCFEQNFSEDPQAFLKQNYDPVNGMFYPDVVHDSIPAVRRGVIRARRSLRKAERAKAPQYSKADLYQLTEQALTDAMNATPEKVGAVRATAEALED